jgi:hypothetical protein
MQILQQMAEVRSVSLCALHREADLLLLDTAFPADPFAR